MMAYDSGPSPVPMNKSWMSRRRQTWPSIKYSLSPERNSRRVTAISPERWRSLGGRPRPPWPSPSLSSAAPSGSCVSTCGRSSSSSAKPASSYSGSTSVMLTSAMLVGGLVPVPLKMTSDMRSPRRLFCSPRTQETASDRLDLPQPFGPTMAATPPENSSRERSPNDLKPSSSSFFSLYKLHPFPLVFPGRSKPRLALRWRP